LPLLAMQAKDIEANGVSTSAQLSDFLLL